MPPLTLGPIENAGVLGGGTAFPRLLLTNEEVLSSLPEEAWGERGRPSSAEALAFAAEGIAQTLGVRQRAWAHRVGTPLSPTTEESSYDLALAAAARALVDAQLTVADIDLLIAVTSTPHRMTSTLSGAVGAGLGLTSPCLDVRTGCAAGLFALTTAALYLQAGARQVLLVAAETFSKVVPPQSKVGALSLADGAGALVLGRVEGAALEAAFLDTDGTLGKLLSTDGALPPTPGELERGGYLLSGAPDALTEAVPAKYEAAIRGALARGGLGIGAIDHYVPHQTSQAVIAQTCAAVGLAPSKAFVNLERHGNIGVAGWVVALIEARQAQRFSPGQRLLLAAVGGGMSWASAVLRLGPSR